MIISFANQKGGVGKTTSAINIAACVAALDKKVLLVDMDPQGNASTGVGFIDKSNYNTTFNLITEGLPPNEAIYSTEFKNLDIIPSEINLAGAELQIADIEFRERILKRALDDIKNDYDYIFIDCPPALGLLTINALVASDGVVIPVQCEFYALEGLVQLTKTIDLVKAFHNPRLEYTGILITMLNTRLIVSGQIITDLKKHYGDLLFKTPITRNIRLAEAPAYGIPVLYMDKFSKGAINYTAVAKELIARTTND